MYLTQGLQRACQQHPDSEAVRYAGRGLTYAQFADRVARLAGALQALGVQPGDRVAMLSLNSGPYLEYLMAVPWAGAVLNPVNYRWSPAEILYSLDDSATGILIVDDHFRDVGLRMKAECRSLRHVIHVEADDARDGLLAYEQLIDAHAPVPDAHRHGDALAGIFYTGGTTGFPKGVMLSHNNLISSAINPLILGTIAPGARGLHVMPMFHLADFALCNSVFLCGGTHVVMPNFDPGAMLALISDACVTTLMLAPTLIQMALQWIEANPAAVERLDLTCLRQLMYGASAMSPALLASARAAFPQAEFSQAYGMTELSPVATMLAPEYHSDDPVMSKKMASVGRPVAVAEVRVVDPEGRELPRGDVGEIAVRGPGVMLGYWNQPEATAAAVRDGWMHTGDGGYMDEDGFLFLVDRIKDMIISGGENVYSAEVENAMAGHPAVLQCAVIGLPDEKWGERVHAVVVARPGATLTLAAVQAHCRDHIAGYKIPRSLALIDAMPLSGVGKVMKNDLRQRFAAES